MCNVARIFTIKTTSTYHGGECVLNITRATCRVKKCAVTVKIQGFIAYPSVTNTKKRSQSNYFFQHGTVASVNYFCNKILLLLNAYLYQVSLD